MQLFYEYFNLHILSFQRFYTIIKLSSLHKSLSLNDGGVCAVFGDFNGSFNGVSGFPSVEGVSRSIVDAIFDGAFGVSKDTVDGRRGIFDKANGSGFSVGAKLSTCSHTQ